MVDIGTGDGLNVYHAARDNPNNFYIGIDCNTRPLEKVSEKIFRKPAKGGASNLLYLLASVESLPAELEGIAHRIQILFPWGSLLRAVALGEQQVLKNLRMISAPNASLEIVIGFDPKTDQSELQRLGISSLSHSSIQETLIPRYETLGFKATSVEILKDQDWSALKSSWAQRLRQNPARVAFQLLFKANNP